VKVAVLVSTSRHPLSGLPRRSANDSVALELARTLPDAQLTVLHAGETSDPALADYLALGAPAVHVVPARPDADIVGALLPHIKDMHLVLTGMRADGGQSSGMLPYLVSSALGWRLVSGALAIEPRGEGVFGAVQFLPKGERRRVEVRGPLVAAVHPAAPLRPRYAYARRLAGYMVTLPPFHGSDADAATWTEAPADRSPVKLRPPERRGGHARMQAALAAPSRGGEVAIEGSEVVKAQLLLRYLQQHGCVELTPEESP
jgi:electron transfer flavoprotein beta subunit